MKPCVILFFVFRQVTESVTVMKIQPINTTNLFDFVFPCRQTILSWSVRLPLEWLYINQVTIGSKSFFDSGIGIILAKIFKSYRLVISLWGNRPIFSARTQVIEVTHTSYFHEIIEGISAPDTS